MWRQELELDPRHRYSAQLVSILFHRVLPRGNSNPCVNLVLQRPEWMNNDEYYSKPFQNKRFIQ